MIRLNSKVAKSEISDDKGQHWATQLYVWCPGCDQLHGVVVEGSLPGNDACWDWDGDTVLPTFTPSIKVTYGTGKNRPQRVCHSFIKKGQWEFLGDCYHSLKNTHHDLVDLPDWVGCHLKK